MEGVAFAAKRNLAVLERKSGRIEALSPRPGAHVELWLEIKASIYDRTILVPAEAEAGVIGCAMVAAVVGGAAADSGSRGTLRRLCRRNPPNPQWRDRYLRSPNFSTRAMKSTAPCGSGSTR